MLDKKYYCGYEGEGEIIIWSDENAIAIWIGYFDTILEGCFHSGFQKNGILECYFNQNGFYEERWEIKYPNIVLEELNKFNEKSLNTKDEYMIKISKEIIKIIEGFINRSVSAKRKMFIEYF